jgi:hypothetical protein
MIEYHINIQHGSMGIQSSTVATGAWAGELHMSLLENQQQQVNRQQGRSHSVAVYEPKSLTRIE